ncbi:putative NADPH--hemoprotein reductase [Helianthus annuus]|nr:putative NADPH--hemoprotein reductase [Helianthus annuus]
MTASNFLQRPYYVTVELSAQVSTGASLPPPFPPCTLRKALACYANVLSSPNKAGC